MITSGSRATTSSPLTIRSLAAPRFLRSAKMSMPPALSKPSQFPEINGSSRPGNFCWLLKRGPRHKRGPGIRDGNAAASLGGGVPPSDRAPRHVHSTRWRWSTTSCGCTESKVSAFVRGHGRPGARSGPPRAIPIPRSLGVIAVQSYFAQGRNPAFRQFFTSQFIPSGTKEQADWFNELQRISASPEDAVRILNKFNRRKQSMARGGARPGAGRPARKTPSTRARARAREAAGNQRPWPADKVERWGIDRLIPYAKNARTHTDAQVAAIAASIKEWGWTTPALVGEDGGLIAGHARILAAWQLGIAEITVMVAAGWSEAQKRAYVLADNQLAITGSGWDPELLRLRRRPPARWRCRPALAVWWI
jgi:hypothetical protein